MSTTKKHIEKYSLLTFSLCLHELLFYTVSQKKRANFETVYLKIIRIDFDDIWQKYSKDSRIEFACFGFRVGLLFYQLFVFETGHQK